jgi:transcriptional regulator with XRE-family HTH domain
MENEQIHNISKSDKISFGSIIQRERKKSGKTLKKVEEELTVKVEKVIDGKIVIDEEALITASYLNRIENESRANISFTMVCLLIKKFNLDLNEVFKSFDYEDIIAGNVKQSDIETMLRVNNFEAPIKLGSKEDNKPLTNIEKEILIRIINNVYEFGTTHEENTMYTLKKLFEDLDDYRKSRRKLADSLIDGTTE